MATPDDELAQKLADYRDYRPRRATTEEILAAYASSIRYGWKVRFRHFTQERCAPRARSGVQHRRYSQALLRIEDGVLGIHHQGRHQPVTATWTDHLADGTCLSRPQVFDLRLDSPHLEW